MVSQKQKYCKSFERNSHWRKLSMIMVWERYCNASPKPEFFLFSLFIFSFISQLIWVRFGWNFHRWFSIQKQVKWCTIDPFSLKFCTSQHSYPVPLKMAFWIMLLTFLLSDAPKVQWKMKKHPFLKKNIDNSDVWESHYFDIFCVFFFIWVRSQSCGEWPPTPAITPLVGIRTSNKIITDC